MAKEIPVYLFTGFLEAGKTSLIQETMQDPKFRIDGNTLIILCEEGEIELEPADFVDGSKNCYVRVVEDEEDFTEKTLKQWVKETKADRIMLEYNGMWMLQTLFENMPDGWIVYQEALMIDATTFLTYNANMRSLVVDKLNSCDMVVFNRCDPSIDRMALHQIVRGTSRRTDIIYDNGGDVEFDTIEDPLPFDIDAPVVEIEDKDYALWYRDAADEPDKYNGKTLRFKARVGMSRTLAKGQFVPGRHVMTCCADDIQFMGFICQYKDYRLLKHGEWVIVTVTARAAKHPAYGGQKGLLLTAVSVEPAAEPEQEVAAFY